MVVFVAEMWRKKILIEKLKVRKLFKKKLVFELIFLHIQEQSVISKTIKKYPMSCTKSRWIWMKASNIYIYI